MNTRRNLIAAAFARAAFPFRTCFCLLIIGTGIFSGCATYRPYAQPATRTSPGSVSFSDELSRDLVHQTRKLLELKDRDYMVGADDVLEVSIFEWEMSEETKTLECRVAESGIISLPALGAVKVADMTIQGIQKTIEDELLRRNVLQNPRVGVAVKEYRSRRIAVIGEVNAPGVYAIHENVSTLMDMLTLAGGPKETAGQVAYVLRSQSGKSSPIRITVDLEELFDEGVFSLNAVLQGDDIVYVPRAPLVYVYGRVREPGGFTLRRSMRALEVLALAGGFAARADKYRCYITRRKSGRPEHIIKLNMKRIERGLDVNPFLQENDVLHVPESTGKTLASELWGVVRGIFTFTYRLDSGGQ